MFIDEELDENKGGASTPEQETATEPKEPAEDAPTEAEKTDETSSTGVETQKTVPYNRFREVISQKNEAIRLKEEAERELESFRSQSAVVPPVDKKPKFTDPKTQAFYDAAVTPIVEEINEFRRQTEAERYADRILKEVDGLTAKSFPEADKEWVINALIGNPKAKVADLVKYSHDKTVALKKSVIDKYVKSKQEEAKHKAKSPAGSAPAAKTPELKGKSFGAALKSAEIAAGQRLTVND